MKPRPRVTVYTDGACLGNPGPGGYGIVLQSGSHRKELAGGFRLTTNNRMELLAAIVALELLKEPSSVVLHSDSQYLVNAITQGWAVRWQKNGWKRNKREKAENIDLWERLLPLLEHHDVTFRWVRGHAGNNENERCDELSRGAASGKGLVVDENYEGMPR